MTEIGYRWSALAMASASTLGVIAASSPIAGLGASMGLLGVYLLWNYFRVFLLGFIFFLPLMFALSPTANIDLAVTRLIIPGLFFVLGLRVIWKREEFVVGGVVTLLLVLFLGVAALSIPIAAEPILALRRFFVFATLVPIYFVVVHIASSEKKVDQIVRVLFWSGFSVAILGLAQFGLQFVFGYEVLVSIWENMVAPIFLGVSTAGLVVNNPSWLVDISGETVLRAFAFFPDPHMFSFYLGMTLPFGLSMYKKNKIISVVALVTMALAILLSFSRGGYIAIIASITILTIVYRKEVIKHVVHPIAVGLAVVALVLLFTQNPVSQRFVSSFNTDEGSNFARLTTWHEAIDIIVDHPLMGVGIGNYAQAIEPGISQKNAISSHNVYLEFTAEMGILGLVFWIGLLVVVGNILIKSYTAKSKIIPVVLGMSVVYFAAHSVFETPQYSPIILPLFMIVIGLSVSQYKAQSA